ncbi:MAG: hypothetical protein HQ483_17875 [Rhodospirillales bacterium]|nr:hypothetical protein [Rhodospirillales bacterium]
MSGPRQAVLVLLVCGMIGQVEAAGAEVLAFDEAERQLIESHGPWPPAPRHDPSNRVSGNPDAIELGRHLYFDAELSIDGSMSCATCHIPKTGLGDGLATGKGREQLSRNTPHLFNLAYSRWYGWGGGADSLWAQSIRPIMAPLEMAATPTHVVTRIKDQPLLSCLYQKTFGSPVAGHGEQEGLVNAAKSLAAFQETMVTGRTSFDAFRDALLAGDSNSADQYPVEAQRGLKLFVGKGQCSLCHFGPQFTNGEFGDVGIPHFHGKGVVDKGRYGGIQNLQKTPYSLAGPFSDDGTEKTARKTRHVTLQDRNWGEFKTPSLRNVAETAPYMHNGSLPTLDAVVRHYSEIDEARLHVDGEKILKPLHLSVQETGDLVAFLKSLSAPLVQPINEDMTAAECSPGHTNQRP